MKVVQQTPAPNCLQLNPKAQPLGAAIDGRLREALDKVAAIAHDHALRRQVAGSRGQLDIRKSLPSRKGQKERQSARSIATLALLRHDRKPNVTEAMRRQIRRSRLPSQILHSSTRIIAATAVIGFVSEAMRTIVSCC